MSNPLYVFDMDETLINGDCAMIWNEFLVEKGIAIADNFLAEDKRLMALYAQGKMDMEDYLQFSMAPLANMSIAQVDQLVLECVEQRILPKQFERSQLLIEQLNQQNADMVIISATVSFVVAAVGRRIGILLHWGLIWWSKMAATAPKSMASQAIEKAKLPDWNSGCQSSLNTTLRCTFILTQSTTYRCVNTRIMST